jgi:hypothetical protein
MSSDSSYDEPYVSWDTETVSKTGPTIPWGLPKLSVLRHNPPIGSDSLGATRTRDEVTQMVTSS